MCSALRVPTHLILIFCVSSMFNGVRFSLVDVFATVNLELAKEIGKGIGLTQAEIDNIKPLVLPDGSD